MSHDPFAPPETEQLAEGHLGPWVLVQILFSFEGRISRTTYWAGMMGVGAAWYGFLALAGEQAPFWSPPATGAVAMWCTFALQTKRWHDMGKTGWMVSANMVPYIGALYGQVMCGFGSGTRASNPYGAEPVWSDPLGKRAPGTIDADGIDLDLIDD